MTTAAEITSNFFNPPLWESSSCYGEFYKNHPVMARVIFMPLAFLRGAGKVFLFPVITAVGAVTLPLFGIFKSIWNSRCEWEYIKAGGMCLLGAGLFLTFMMVSVYHLPLVASSSIFMTAMLVSITVHVYQASDVPNFDANPEKTSTDVLRIKITAS